jgi:hypothetical protein
MAYGHLSASMFTRSSKGPSRRLSGRAFGLGNESSMGHGGVAMRESTRFTGAGASTKKFEGESASSSASSSIRSAGWGE